MTKILIAEDRKGDLQSLADFLSQHDCRVTTAGDGAAALAAARQDPPELAISDVFMPVMDGLGLCQEWKQDPKLKNIPIILYTASGPGSDDEELATGLGAERLLPKPEDRDKFHASLLAILTDFRAGSFTPPRQPRWEQPRLIDKYRAALVFQLEETQKALQMTIAGHRRAETALHNQLHFLQQLLDAIPVPVFYKDTHSAYVGCNAAFAAFLGLPKDVILGKKVEELGRPELVEICQKTDASLLQNPGTQIYEAHIPDIAGTDKPREVVFSKATYFGGDNQPAGVVGVILDITKRKEAELELRSERDFSRTLVEASPTFFVAMTVDAKVLMMNPAMLRVSGYTQEEVMGRDYVNDFIPECERPEVLRIFKSLTTNAQTTINENHILTKDGRQILVEWHGSPVLKGKAINYFFGVGVDISERKQAKERLREQEETFRALAENSYDTIMRFDPQCRHLYVNPIVAKQTGIPTEKFIGKRHSELGFPPALCALWDEAILKVVATNAQNRIEFKLPNGTWIDWLLVPEFAPDATVKAIMTSGRDITARKALEDQLRQAQKMEAFGQLAGGVAHDFNNILTVIQGNVRLLQQSPPSPQEQAEILSEVCQAADKAADLTRQLLMFSRRKAMKPRDVDLNELVANMTKMLQRLIGEHISMSAHYAPGGAHVNADPGMLEQIIMNLSVNSRDAMPAGGQLTIKTSLVLVDEDTLKSSPKARAGLFVRLSVSDTGSGISPEHLPHIFEPFFTTKDIGRGTGLGLATVFGIVEQHQGWISLESSVGAGTTFHIHLPRPDKPLPTGASPQEPAAAPGGTETVLIVEDDATVRRLVHRLLEGHGYHVIEAATAREAVQAWQQHKAAIDLLLTDVVMPQGTSGQELAETLLAERPSLKVIYCSGYSEDMLGQGKLRLTEHNFLEKPFDLHLMLSKIRACLDAE
ncbi:MAG: PAS domain S-box protein [Elusimicrobiota bacterium]|jgi:PAS domain S-box-containing protein